MKARSRKAASSLVTAIAHVGLAGLLGACTLDFDRFDRGGPGEPSPIDAASSGDVPADGSSADDVTSPTDVTPGAMDSSTEASPNAEDAGADDTSDAVDSAAADSGCVAACLSSLQSCVAPCVSTRTQCLSDCQGSGCAGLCDTVEQTCESSCTKTCTKCVQRAGCAAASVCSDGG